MCVKIFIIALLCVYGINCRVSTETDDSDDSSNEKPLRKDSDSSDSSDSDEKYVLKKNVDNKIEQVDPGEHRYVEEIKDEQNEDYIIEQVDPGEPRYMEEVKDEKDENAKENISSGEDGKNVLKKDFNTNEELESDENENIPINKNKDSEENDDNDDGKKHLSNKNVNSKEEESGEQHKKKKKDDKVEQVDPGEHRYVQEFKEEEDEGIKEFKHHESNENEENLLREELEREREKQKQAGSVADYFGTHQHYEIPVNFDDFGRRFVLSYPYIEKNNTVVPAEMKLHKDVEEQLEVKKHYFDHLTPFKAPPEFVLSIAKQSAILEATKPKNPSDDVIVKDVLRTGNFWNDVWKEDVDKKKLLRTSSKNKLEKVTVEIEPGSKLYKLVSVLKKRSPVLLYVINKNNAE